MALMDSPSWVRTRGGALMTPSSRLSRTAALSLSGIGLGPSAACTSMHLGTSLCFRHFLLLLYMTRVDVPREPVSKHWGSLYVCYGAWADILWGKGGHEWSRNSPKGSQSFLVAFLKVMAATWRIPTSKLSSTATLSRFTNCPGTC